MIIGSMINIDNENYIIAVVGYVIVFVALFLLVAMFLAVPKIVQMQARRIMRKKGQEIPQGRQTEPISGEENAAIAMAIHLFLSEIHDEESNVVTIRKVAKMYSPWSSKIYGLNGTGRKVW
jgi:glutaconyl-CoA/methylmalonyl-CoA decarboxylase subunit delta